jgi:hypothetical protein
MRNQKISNHTIQFDLLEELSTAEQEVLSGGHRYRYGYGGYPYGYGYGAYPVYPAPVLLVV